MEIGMEGFFLVLTDTGPKDFKGRSESALRCRMGNGAREEEHTLHFLCRC